MHVVKFTFSFTIYILQKKHVTMSVFFNIVQLHRTFSIYKAELQQLID